MVRRYLVLTVLPVTWGVKTSSMLVKPLKNALAKYGMDSLKDIKNQVSNGKSAMPAFKNKLSDKQIEDVATYVLEQAEEEW